MARRALLLLLWILAAPAFAWDSSLTLDGPLTGDPAANLCHQDVAMTLSFNRRAGDLNGDLRNLRIRFLNAAGRYAITVGVFSVDGVAQSRQFSDLADGVDRVVQMAGNSVALQTTATLSLMLDPLDALVVEAKATNPPSPPTIAYEIEADIVTTGLPDVNLAFDGSVELPIPELSFEWVSSFSPPPLNLCPVEGVTELSAIIKGAGGARAAGPLKIEFDGTNIINNEKDSAEYVADGADYYALDENEALVSGTETVWNLDEQARSLELEIDNPQQNMGVRFKLSAKDDFITFARDTNGYRDSFPIRGKASIACGVTQRWEVPWQRMNLPVAHPDIRYSFEKPSDLAAAGLEQPDPDERFLIATPNSRIEWRHVVTNPPGALPVPEGSLDYRAFDPIDLSVFYSNATDQNYPAFPAVGDTEKEEIQDIDNSCRNFINTGRLNWRCSANHDFERYTDDGYRVMLAPEFDAGANIYQDNQEGFPNNRPVALPNDMRPLVEQDIDYQSGGRSEVTLRFRNGGATARNVTLQLALPSSMRLDQSTPTALPVAQYRLEDGTMTAWAEASFVLNNPVPGTVTFLRESDAIDIGYGDTLHLRFRLLPHDQYDDYVANPLSDGAEQYAVSGVSDDPSLPESQDYSVTLMYDLQPGCSDTNRQIFEKKFDYDTRRPDVDITVNPAASEVENGETTAFTFTVTNNGTSAADNLTFRLPLLGGGWESPTLTPGNDVQCNVSGAITRADLRTMECSLPQLGRNESRTITLAVTARNRATTQDNALPIVAEVVGLLRNAAGGNPTAEGGDNASQQRFYSFDAIRPRVVGLQIESDLLGTTEDFTAGDNELTIGEDLELLALLRWFGVDVRGNTLGQDATGTAHHEWLQLRALTEAVDDPLGHVRYYPAPASKYGDAINTDLSSNRPPFASFCSLGSCFMARYASGGDLLGPAVVASADRRYNASRIGDHGAGLGSAMDGIINDVSPADGAVALGRGDLAYYSVVRLLNSGAVDLDPNSVEIERLTISASADMHFAMAYPPHIANNRNQLSDENFYNTSGLQVQDFEATQIFQKSKDLPVQPRGPRLHIEKWVRNPDPDALAINLENQDCAPTPTLVGSGWKQGLFADSDEVDGQDELVYCVRITNSGSAPAFGLRIEDALQTPELTFISNSFGATPLADDTPSVSSPNAYRTAQLALFTEDNLSLPDAGTDAGKTLLQLNPLSSVSLGDPPPSIALVYKVKVDENVSPDQVLDNRVRLISAWSLPNRPDYQGNQTAGYRGRAGSLAGSRNLAQDFLEETDNDISDSAPVRVKNVANLFKIARKDFADAEPDLLLDDLLGSTESGVDQALDFRVGDIATYVVRAYIEQQTEIDNFSIADDLGQRGLFFTGEHAIRIQGISLIDPPNVDAVAAPTAGSRRHRWFFEKLTVDSGGAYIEITYRVRIGSNFVPEQGDARGLLNEAVARYQYQDSNDMTQNKVARARHQIDVPQPELVPHIQLLDSDDGSAVVLAEPYPSLAPGDPDTDTVHVSLRVENISSNAPAYDPLLEVTIPEGARKHILAAGLFEATLKVRNRNNRDDSQPAADTVVADIDVDFASNGLLRWQFDDDDGHRYAIPPQGFLELRYSVTVDDDIGAGLEIAPKNLAHTWYSRPENERLRRRYGPSAVASLGLSTARPGKLLKTGRNTDSDADDKSTLGDQVEYTLTVPAEPVQAALYNIKVIDQLPPHVTFRHAVFENKSALELENANFDLFDRLSGDGFSARVDSDNKLTISSQRGYGFSLPPGKQATFTVMVSHDTRAGGDDGDVYSNYADYSWHSLPRQDSLAGHSPSGDLNAIGRHDMTVIEPRLLLTKTGDEIIYRNKALLPDAAGSDYPVFGYEREKNSAAFAIDVCNMGTSTAWEYRIEDYLPPLMREMQPEIKEVSIIRDGQAENVILEPDRDYRLSYDAAQGLLQFDFDMEQTRTANEVKRAALNASPQAALARPAVNKIDCLLPQDQRGDRLHIEYIAFLDEGATDGSVLINRSGVRQWFSKPRNQYGQRLLATRHYYRSLGAAVAKEYEDIHRLYIGAPVVDVLQSVQPYRGVPGASLLYTLRLVNRGLGPGVLRVQNDFGRLDEHDILLPASFDLQRLRISDSAGNELDPSSYVNNSHSDGKGLLSVRDIRLDAGAEMQIQYVLASRPVLTLGKRLENQAEVWVEGFSGYFLSDDPRTSERFDPTVVEFDAAPEFLFTKSAEDISGDSAHLRSGDSLRYHLHIENQGSEHSKNSHLHDSIPSHTHYVPNSTYLNGEPVPDIDGLSPLMMRDGLQLKGNGPFSEDGVLLARSGYPAQLRFDVVVDSSLVNGAVLSNQALLRWSGSEDSFSVLYSDDPDTVLQGDPTRSIVGEGVLLDVQMTVSSNHHPFAYSGSRSRSRSSSKLTYLVTIANQGNIEATGLHFSLDKDLEGDRRYQANSTQQALGTQPWQPIGDVNGDHPLLVADQDSVTLPLLLPNLAAGDSMSLRYTMAVDDDLDSGTGLKSQGILGSRQWPDVRSDDDANPYNGRAPTRILVGDAHGLSVSHEARLLKGHHVLPGTETTYLVRVRNSGVRDLLDVRINDRAKIPPDGMMIDDKALYQVNSSRFNGVAVDDAAADADGPVQIVHERLRPGEELLYSYRIVVKDDSLLGARLINRVYVSHTDSSNVEVVASALDIGGTPQAAAFSGRVFRDINHDDIFQELREQGSPDWRIKLYFRDVLQAETKTNAQGIYQLQGLQAGEGYRLAFTYPDQQASLGVARSGAFTATQSGIEDMALPLGSYLVEQDYPLAANGVVYDSILRIPAAGVKLTMFDAAGRVLDDESCFEDPAQQGQITAAHGLYKFVPLFDSGCFVSEGSYRIRVEGGGGYLNQESRVLPPQDTAFDVTSCADAVAATDQCELHVSAQLPSQQEDHDYHLTLKLADEPFKNQLYNNHIPVDPLLLDAVQISKYSRKKEVMRSELVPFSIRFSSRLEEALMDIELIDLLPPGFKYVAGSARLGDTPLEPLQKSGSLHWEDLKLAVGQRYEMRLLLAISSGVGEGLHTNRSYLRSSLTGNPVSSQASASVAVIPDALLDCAGVMGRVFDDRNANGFFDSGEIGLAGARVLTTRGMAITTDSYGRYHVPCISLPDMRRGSNVILKLDVASLPSGYRLTTENPRVKRVTRGKLSAFNFGAALGRVVRMDLSMEVFEPEKLLLRPQWQPRLERLLDELRKEPSVLRLSYLGDLEQEVLAEKRLQAIRQQIKSRWEALRCCYNLSIETELFWRRGAPVNEDDG